MAKKSKKFKTAKPKKKKRNNLPAQKMGQQPRDERWELFCLEFIKDQNGARAARDAGYSAHTAKEMACELLTRPNIKLRITALLNERKARVKMEGDEILLETGKLARSDIRDLIDENGCVLPVHQWPDHIAVCVASIEVREVIHPFTGQVTGYVKKLKLWDKVKPQELIGKNTKQWKDTVEHEGTIGVQAVDAAQVKQKVDELEKDV